MKVFILIASLVLSGCVDREECNLGQSINSGSLVLYVPTKEKVRIVSNSFSSHAQNCRTLNKSGNYKIRFADGAEIWVRPDLIKQEKE